MAGERKGKAYEALVSVALNELVRRRVVAGQVFWNKKPSGMTIEPDFTLGPDSDNPTHLILVTHSGSAKESEKKFWRNMGELAEAKLFLATIPHVYNVAFDAVIKEDLKRVQSAAFDGQLIVGDLDFGRSLQSWVDSNQIQLPKGAEDKSAKIHTLLSTDKNLRGLIAALTSNLELMLTRTRPEVDHLWTMERSRKAGAAPAARDTFVRRGLSKLLIFEDINLALRLYRGKRVPVNEVPDNVFELNLAGKAIGHATPSDAEIKSAVSLLSDIQIRAILSAERSELLESWLTSLRGLSFVDRAHDYVTRHFASLAKPEGMLKALTLVDQDPQKELGATAPISVNWLFQIVFDLQRASEKQHQGMGYAQLIQIAIDHSVQINIWLRRCGLDEFTPRGNSAIVRGLTDWVNRRSTKHALAFSRTYQAVVAWVLSKGLSAITKSKLPESANLKSFTIINLLNQKLLTYRGFDPIGHLICEANAQMPEICVKTCFGEAAGITGLGGNMTVGKIGNTIVNWQSATDAGRDHKKKELCGRAIGLRYTWDSSTRKFIHRQGIKQLVLVIDGTWRQDDLNALVRSGWDHIFYPDEMDRLVKAIV